MRPNRLLPTRNPLAEAVSKRLTLDRGGVLAREQSQVNRLNVHHGLSGLSHEAIG